MSQLADIESAQRSLEANVTKRMAELEAQLHSGVPAKDTAAKVGEEFRTYRELVFSMFVLLRQQIASCNRSVDVLESRHRRKSLLFLGLPEGDKENCTKTIVDVVQNKLELKNISAPDISTCHRIGSPNSEHHRPILVWFTRLDNRSAVWKAKSALKGSSVSVREFLTKSRQSVFAKGRQHFGLKNCWTESANIVIKAPDGSRHKIISIEELEPLMDKYSKASSDTSTAARKAHLNAGPSGVNVNTKNTTRK